MTSNRPSLGVKSRTVIQAAVDIAYVSQGDIAEIPCCLSDSGSPIYLDGDDCDQNRF